MPRRQVHAVSSNNPNNGTLASKVETIEIVLSEMDAAITHVYATVTSLQRKLDPSYSDTKEDNLLDSKGTMRDSVWACSNCMARLGIYNTEKDELRVRYKDFVAYIYPGVGGKTMVPCRRCGEQNQLSDTRELDKP